jgi:alpha-D-ribose 1-methylphosphonate 5-triphosphate synthase subunit PhnG
LQHAHKALLRELAHGLPQRVAVHAKALGELRLVGQLGTRRQAAGADVLAQLLRNLLPARAQCGWVCSECLGFIQVSRPVLILTRIVSRLDDIGMNASPGPTPQVQRADWLRVLAQAPAALLAARAEPHLAGQAFEALREPEEGLVMLRARIGNTGDRFNLGEATVTRCVLRHVAPDGQQWLGVGHVLGRDAAHARSVAQLDALLQRPDLQATLLAEVVAPLREALLARHRNERAQTEATRVRFFTLQPEAA